MSWVATVLYKTDELKITEETNAERLGVTSELIRHIARETSGDGVVLFPGGWLKTGTREPRTIYQRVEETTANALSEIDGKNMVAVLGIDGRTIRKGDEDYNKDQIGIAVSKRGIEAVARKFYPTRDEKVHIETASSTSAIEDDKTRCFDLAGRRYFVCVCYDVFGLKSEKISTKVDVFLGLIHGFMPAGMRGSGDVYFAKHGMAGAAKKHGSPVFATAVFFNREITNFPSGVCWNHKDKTTHRWRYSDNPLKPFNTFRLTQKNAGANKDVAEVRLFDVESAIKCSNTKQQM